MGIKKEEMLILNVRRCSAANSTYPKGGVSCSKDRFVVNGSLVFHINFCGKIPALRVAANRQVVKILSTNFQTQ